LQVEIFAKIFYLGAMRIIDETEQQIQQSEAGTLFFVSDFAKTGNDVFISRVLSEFADKGLLCRLAKGVYYKPIETRYGILYPDVADIVKAIARRDNAQVLPTGEAAQNMLGLSTQVPMNYVYLTSGSARKIEVGPRTVTFKRCVPKNFAVKNEFLAVLIQAMKSIGEDRMTDRHRIIIKGLLQQNLPIETFEQDLKVAPIWVRKTIWNIAKEIGK
jgi:hypothetical protein